MKLHMGLTFKLALVFLFALALLASVSGPTYPSGSLVLLAAALAVWLAWSITRVRPAQPSRPALAMQAGAARFGRGERPATSGDEPGQWAREFNVMAASLSEETQAHEYADSLEQRIEERTAALRALSARLEAILSAVPDIIMQVDNDKVYTWANQAGCEFFGEDVIGRQAAFYFEGEQGTYRAVQPLFNGDENVIYIESWQRRKDGRKRLLAWWRRVLKDDRGNVTGALSSAHDITERVRTEAVRQQAEARLVHLNEVLRAVRDVNQLIARERDPQQLMTAACASLVRTRGYRMAWIGLIEAGHGRVMPAARAGQGTDYLDQVVITWDESETGLGPTGAALRTRQPAVCANTATDPRYAPWREAALQHGLASSAAVPVLHGDRLFGVINVYADKPDAFDDEEISLLAELAGDLGFALQSIENEAERKRAEREIEILARFPTENPNPVLRVAQDGRILYANAASQPLLRLWNCAVGEGLPPAWRDRVTEAAASNSRSTVDVECGEQVYSILAAPIQAAGYVNLYGRDVTERRRAEEALRASEDRYRDLVEHSQDLICTHDLAGRLLSVNQAATRALGYAADELVNRNLLDFMPPGSADGFSAYLAALRERGIASGLLRVLTRAGQTRIWEYNNNLRQVEGEPPMVRGMARDVTERRRAEAALRESENKWKYVFDHSPVGKSITLPAGKINVNQALCEMLGYTRVELENKRWQDITHPEDIELTHKAMGSLLSGEKESVRFVKRYMHKSGAVVWTDVSSSLRRDQDGKPLYFMTTVSDITEHKRTEAERQALLEIIQGVAATESLQELFELIRQSLAQVIYAENLFVVFHNKSTGLFEEVFAVDQYDAPMPPSKLERSITAYIFRTGDPLLLTPARFEELAARGQVELVGAKPASWLGAPLKTPGETIGVIAVQNYVDPDCYSERDREFLASVGVQASLAIERKRAEEAQRESEERLRSILDNIQDGCYEVDTAGNFTFLNPALVRMLGRPANELMGMNNRRYMTPEGGKAVFQTFNRVFRTGIPEQALDWDLVRPDGTLRSAEVSVSLIQAADGSRHGFRGTVHDITERKRAEHALRESEERYRRLVELLPDGVVVHSEGRIVFSNPASAKIIGAVSPAEQIGKPVIEFVHPEYREQALQRIQQSLGEARPAPLADEKFIRLDGTPIDVQVSAIPFSYAGKPAMLTVFNDITERKRAEEEIRANAARAQALARVAGLLNAKLDLATVLTRVCEETACALSVPAASVTLYDERDHTLKLAAAFGLPPEYRARFASIPRTRHDDQLERKGSTSVIPDIQAAPGGVNRDLMVELHVRTIVIANLEREGQLVGTLAILTLENTRAFTQVELTLLKGLADQAAQAIANARLYEEVEKELAERKRAEEEIKTQLAELQRWHDATLGREMRVLDLKREVNELLGQAGHPARYPSAE